MCVWRCECVHVCIKPTVEIFKEQYFVFDPLQIYLRIHILRLTSYTLHVHVKTRRRFSMCVCVYRRPHTYVREWAHALTRYSLYPAKNLCCTLEEHLRVRTVASIHIATIHFSCSLSLSHSVPNRN